VTPAYPVFPGYEAPVTVFAADQPEYIPLPAYRTEDGMVITRWRLTWRERLQVLLTGNLWLSVLTFNRPLQPVKMDTVAPIEKGGVA